jgi:hypothetical protein
MEIAREVERALGRADERRGLQVAGVEDGGHVGGVPARTSRSKMLGYGFCPCADFVLRFRVHFASA